MNCAIHTEVPATAFCRTCGKALCDNCKRNVMGALYCEPCIAVRLQGSASVPPSTTVPGMVVEAPSPGLATLLGFIPGVGAMYNGQFVKAFLHVVIFVSLIVAASEISGFFGILIGFFVLYMVFEAHETAKAKRAGQPSPDPLGLEHLFGIQENHPPVQRPTVVTQGGVQPQRVGRDNTPSGAIVLIILGVVFLVGNISQIHMHKMWPLLLIGFGLWIAYKRAFERG